MVADYFELEQLGIRKVIHKGRNEYGLKEKEIIMNDGSVWDYIPEDNLYEKKDVQPSQVVYHDSFNDLRYVSPEVGHVDQDEEYY